MLKALQTAALRGVDVRIIIPEKPDLFLVGWANSAFFRDLLKAGVKLYLFKDGYLHSKAFTADDEITSVGSANLNTRSLFLDYEANAVIYDEEIAKDMKGIFQSYFDKSVELTLRDYRKHPASHNWLKHILSKLMIPFA
jgi:cardiolipin synthase